MLGASHILRYPPTRSSCKSYTAGQQYLSQQQDPGLSPWLSSERDAEGLCAAGTDSEVLLKPRAIYRDPFRGGDNILVMCDTYKPPSPADSGHDIKLEALPTNTRQACNVAMEKAKDHKPWFGIEQVHPSLLQTWPSKPPQSGFCYACGPLTPPPPTPFRLAWKPLTCHLSLTAAGCVTPARPQYGASYQLLN